MPRTVDHHCNMTLPRAQWSVLVALLDRVRTERAANVKIAIDAAIRASDGDAVVSVDRETDKWRGVISMVFNLAMKTAEGRSLYDAMRVQVQASETEVW